MSAEVKGVTDVVRELDDVKKLATSVSSELLKNIEDVKQGLGLVQEVSTALRNAGAELRGVLGTQSNNPPAPAAPPNPPPKPVG